MDSTTITLTKEQALKILACLGSAIYKEDGEFIKNRNDRFRLIDMQNDSEWGIADQLGIDLNDYYVDFNTLEIEKC